MFPIPVVCHHFSPGGVLTKLKTKVETGTEEVSRIEAAKTEFQAQVRSGRVSGSFICGSMGSFHGD